MLVSSGFVIHPGDLSLCSREQDILILDISREAPVYNHAGVVVAFPEQVLGAISVKTQFRKRELLDSCDTLNSLLHVYKRASSLRRVWCGAFFLKNLNRRPASLRP